MRTRAQSLEGVLAAQPDSRTRRFIYYKGDQSSVMDKREGTNGARARPDIPRPSPDGHVHRFSWPQETRVRQWDWPSWFRELKAPAQPRHSLGCGVRATEALRCSARVRISARSMAHMAMATIQPVSTRIIACSDCSTAAFSSANKRRVCRLLAAAPTAERRQAEEGLGTGEQLAQSRCAPLTRCPTRQNRLWWRRASMSVDGAGEHLLLAESL